MVKQKKLIISIFTAAVLLAILAITSLFAQTGKETEAAGKSSAENDFEIRLAAEETTTSPVSQAKKEGVTAPADMPDPETDPAGYIDWLKEYNALFEDTKFGSDVYQPMIGDSGAHYTTTKSGEPWVTPDSDITHPVFFAGNLDSIKNILAKGQDESSEYYYLANNFWNLVNAPIEDVMNPNNTSIVTHGHHWGIFPLDSKKVDGVDSYYQYRAAMLSIIEAKAMAYRITGEERYALEALICIKNAMLTIHYTTAIHMDVYHGPSHVMITLTAVYDWCYDYIKPNAEQKNNRTGDAWQLIYGVAQLLAPQMEIKYPPKEMNGVSGHGTGPQLLRNWLSAAVVFFNEAPDWYRYVGGRFFNEYLTVSNIQYQNGWISQGTAGYGFSKPHYVMTANLLIRNMTGENFLTDDARLLPYNMMSYILPNGRLNDYNEYIFATGDGQGSINGNKLGSTLFFSAAALYNDPAILAIAKQLTNDYQTYDQSTSLTMTPAMQACFISYVTNANVENFKDSLDTIQYFAAPTETMTARESWTDADSAVVLMRMGNRTMANHDIYDYGTFQIYYKGLLTTASGAYHKYGSPHHKYYHQATVSANGLLVYNPTLAGDNASQIDSYYYSGGQNRRGEAGNIDTWLNGNYIMSEPTGASYGYNADGTSKYAYIAGDLTKAYSSDTVSFIGRDMFTLFTGDEEFPVLFFTFDRINSKNENYTKHWLLHTIGEPTIDTDNLTARTENGDGQLYVESLYGAGAIVKIGGEGKAWWINGDVSKDIASTELGKNLTDEYHNEADDNKLWGRIELRAVGSTATNLLTAMAVTDKGNTTAPEIVKFTNGTNVFGAQYGNNIVAFYGDAAENTARGYEEFEFATEGNGYYDYFITGVEAGTWKVSVDGITVAYVTAEEGESTLTFKAETGNVTVSPCSDVLGVTGGRIVYNTNQAFLSSDVPYTYGADGVTLPDASKISKNDSTSAEYTFNGWYTDSALTAFVTGIPAGTKGTFTVYAKWTKTSEKATVANETYTLTYVYGYGAKVETVENIKTFTDTVLPADIARDGYTFGGWYTNESFIGEPVKKITAGAQGDVKVYAKWIENKTEATEGITKVSVSLGSDFSLNYYVKLPQGVDISAVSMKFTANGFTDKTVTKYTTADSGEYIFSFKGIGPHLIATKVTATLYYGDTAKATKIYSVEDYCYDALIEFADDESFEQLVNDLLLYAKAAEAYAEIKGKGADKTGISEIQSSDYAVGPVNSKLSVSGNKNADYYIYAAGVNFDTANELFFKIYAADTNFTVKIGTVEYKGSELKAIEGQTNCYIIYTAPIIATAYNHTKNISLIKDGTAITTLTYSVDTYAYFMKDNDNMRDLAAALYRYGKSCEKYAGTLSDDNIFNGKDDVFS